MEYFTIVRTEKRELGSLVPNHTLDCPKRFVKYRDISKIIHRADFPGRYLMRVVFPKSHPNFTLSKNDGIYVPSLYTVVDYDDLYFPQTYRNYRLPLDLACFYHAIKKNNYRMMDECVRMLPRREILSIRDNIPKIIIICCQKNNLHMLKWFWSKQCFFGNFVSLPEYMDTASKFGNIKILDWFYSKRNIMQLEYTCNSVDDASTNGDLDVVEWWYYHTDLEFYYTRYAIEGASRNQHLHVLEWWRNCNMPKYYSYHALNEAAANGKLFVLMWWFNSGLQLRYTPDAINSASKNGHVHVLDFWKNTGVKLLYSGDAFNTSNSDVIQWWNEYYLSMAINGF